MHIAEADTLLRALGSVLALVTFRAFPFVVYTCVARTGGFLGKLATVAVFAFLCFVTAKVEPRARDLLGADGLVVYGYFAIAAAVVQPLRDALEREWVGPLTLFTLLAALMLVLPAILVPGRPGFALQDFGWELLLSSYSYCRDTMNQRRPRLSECLFFLLVNPVLVYQERGKSVASPGWNGAAALRCALGLAALALFRLLVTTRDAAPLAGALALYAAHSGLASLQIGMMRFVGHVIPERYRYPFLATGPEDFWRRWNTYVGSWASRYLFMPAALAGGRVRWALIRRANKGLAVLLTFGAIGLLHDFGASLKFRAPVHQLAGFFLANAVFLILWNLVVRRIRHAASPTMRTQRFQWIGRGLSWAAWSIFFLTSVTQALNP